MGLDIEIEEKLRCYFFGIVFTSGEKQLAGGLAGFAIPDLGIVYRSRLNGSLFECQYKGLLALLSFIDTNKKNFRGVGFEILSDSAVVIYQITHKKFVSRELLSSLRSVLEFQERIPFKVSWVPTEENISITGLLDMPSYSTEADFDLEIELKDKYKELGKGYMLF
jgi:hypothetical protein